MLQVDVSEIVAHEADEPNAVVDFLRAGRIRFDPEPWRPAYLSGSAGREALIRLPGAGTVAAGRPSAVLPENKMPSHLGKTGAPQMDPGSFVGPLAGARPRRWRDDV